MKVPRTAVVVGGGIAGLATAALLARDGISVDLLEKNDDVGGRAGVWERDGFRFDTGPSWYLMPEVFDHFFRLMGTSAAAELDLVALDPGYRTFFEGNGSLDVALGVDRNTEAFENIEPGAGAKLTSYLESAQRAYELSKDHFLYSNFSSPSALFDPEVLGALPALLPLVGRPLDRHIARSFSDPRLRQVLGYPAVFLGTSPDRAPSLYHLMSAMDLGDAVRYPMGGMRGIIDVIERLALAEGVRIHTRSQVTAIRVARNAPTRRRRASARGVRFRDADGREHSIDADLVVSAADLHHTETKLLPRSLQTYPETSWRRKDPGPGAILAMLGVEGPLPELAHHSLFFTSDWTSNFDDIFGPNRRVPEPASSYVCRVSATDPSVAPSGSENLFVLIPVPADLAIGKGGMDGAGDPEVEKAVDAAIDQIASWAQIPDLAQRIVVRRSVGPADFAIEFNAWSGGALGPAHTLRQSAFLRGRNVSSRVDGLMYAGASTVPGIGLPMCLISAELVLKRVRGDNSSGPIGGWS